jgi:hypothetical protein
VNSNDIQRLTGIVAKGLRLAKRWYLAYVLCQILVLMLAIGALVAGFDARLGAVLGLVAAIATELLRWRSDFWKSQGELAKRRWEVANGLDNLFDEREVADWLAAKRHDFLDDVTETERMGTQFASALPPGARRLVENTEESAWWSKHESRLIALYLGIGLSALLFVVLITLSVGIGALNASANKNQVAVTQNVGAIVCSVLAFVFSINAVRLFVSFIQFFFINRDVLTRCRQLLNEPHIPEASAISLLFDYQTARYAAPLLPTFIWKFHGRHLRSEWRHFRPQVPAKTS